MVLMPAESRGRRSNHHHSGRSVMSQRSDVLAGRLEQGAHALAAYAAALSEAEWRTRVKDGRKIGVIVHHVATMYPLEIQLAQGLGAGQPVVGVTWDAIHELNAKHARDYDGLTQEKALELQQKKRSAHTAAIL